MQNIFFGLSKYVLMLMMAFFVFFSYLIMRDRPARSYRAALAVQSAMMFVFHFTGFLLILMHTGKMTIVLFYGAQLVFLILIRGMYSLLFDDLHSRGLMNNMCMLLCISFIILTRLDYPMAVKQFVIVCVAAVAGFLVTFVISKARRLSKLMVLYCFTGVILLSVVLILGQTTKGANLSISLFGFAFQPSEFVKILYVFFLASFLEKGTEFKRVVISAVFAGIHVIILVLSRDLGSALIFFMVYVAMVYVASKKAGYLVAGLFGGGLASVAGYHLFPHIRVRVRAFLDPWSVIDNQGYQVTQSLFAIGTGGMIGMGLYQGSPKSVPLVAKDFIFSAIAEELGGFVAICLIFLCVSCFMYFIKSALGQQAVFYKLIGIGFSVIYAVQTILTIGGAIKFIPSTGVTLPLVSYGGSSVLCTMTIFAVLQGLFVIANREEEARLEEAEAEEAEIDFAITAGLNLGEELRKQPLSEKASSRKRPASEKKSSRKRPLPEKASSRKPFSD